MSDRIYGLFDSEPDYSSRGPRLRSLHRTLEGAMAAFADGHYADATNWHKWPSRLSRAGDETWEGPDGFGLIRKLEIHG